MKKSILFALGLACNILLICYSPETKPLPDNDPFQNLDAVHASAGINSGNELKKNVRSISGDDTFQHDGNR